MGKEDFKRLIEIQSLDQKISEHLKNIDEQNGRIEFIKNQRQIKKNLLDETKAKHAQSSKDLSQLENEVHQLEKNLEKAQNRQLSLTTNEQVKATEAEIVILTQNHCEKENQTLEVMAQIEEMESLINDLESFLQGSEKSLNEIKSDVENKISLENKEIKNYELRISLLLDQTPENMRNRFEIINKEFRFNSPLAFIDKGSCNKCYIKISRLDETQVEYMTSLENCMSCGRLLMPLNART